MIRTSQFWSLKWTCDKSADSGLFIPSHESDQCFADRGCGGRGVIPTFPCLRVALSAPSSFPCYPRNPWSKLQWIVQLFVPLAGFCSQWFACVRDHTRSVHANTPSCTLIHGNTRYFRPPSPWSLDGAEEGGNFVEPNLQNLKQIK